MFFIWGKSFQMMIFSRKLFFFTYFNQTELKGWRFRGICSYMYIYISILCILILLYLEPFLGILQKISSIYIMRWNKLSVFSPKKVSIPEVSTSKLDGEILGHLPLETLGPCRCPARISALESSCLVLRGKFFLDACALCPRDNNVNNTSNSTSTSTTNINIT